MSFAVVGVQALETTRETSCRWNHCHLNCKTCACNARNILYRSTPIRHDAFQQREQMTAWRTTWAEWQFYDILVVTWNINMCSTISWKTWKLRFLRLAESKKGREKGFIALVPNSFAFDNLWSNQNQCAKRYGGNWLPTVRRKFSKVWRLQTLRFEPFGDKAGQRVQPKLCVGRDCKRNKGQAV